MALTRGRANVNEYPALENGIYVVAETLDANPLFRIRTNHGDTSLIRNSSPGSKSTKETARTTRFLTGLAPIPLMIRSEVGGRLGLFRMRSIWDTD